MACRKLAQVNKFNNVPGGLEGLRIRVERAHASMDKDLAKAAKLAPFESRLTETGRDAKTMSEDCQRLLEEYLAMLEEFRLSLFAPEIKTAMPVSAKRLEKKWREYQESVPFGSNI